MEAAPVGESDAALHLAAILAGFELGGGGLEADLEIAVCALRRFGELVEGGVNVTGAENGIIAPVVELLLAGGREPVAHGQLRERNSLAAAVDDANVKADLVAVGSGI